MTTSTSSLLKFRRRHLAASLAMILSAATGEAQASPSLSPLGLSEVLIQFATTSAVIPVMNCNDDMKGGTLREALASAQIVEEKIDLSNLQCSTITLLHGQLSTNLQSSSIVGPTGRITIDANHGGRALFLEGLNATVDLENIVVKGGQPVDNYYRGGGCIFSYGNVRLINSYVYDCKVITPQYYTARGGAIYAHGYVGLYDSKISRSSVYSSESVRSEGGGIWANDAIITRSEISGNSATAYANPGVGGGVFAAGTTDAEYSTIAENAASIGGGIYSESTVTLNDSTVSGNTADVGGAVYGDGELVLYSSTVAFNTATTAEGTSGIFSQNGPITMFSSIVASNLTNDNTPAIDVSSAKIFLVAGSHNIVTSSTLALPGDNDPKDPKLGPLSDNGGPTRTHLPLTGSPALASGINRSDKLLVDQRQLSRGIPGNIDIGSVQESLFKSDFESDSVEGGHGGAQQVDRSVVQDFP